MKNSFDDIMLKYFEYHLRIGRYKNLKYFSRDEIIISRFSFFFKYILLFLIIFFSIYGKTVSVIIEVGCLMFVQFFQGISFANFLVDEVKRDVEKK